MKVSVITTAYNHQNTIKRAIDSVQSQVRVDFEHIILDDTNTKNGMMKTYRTALRNCSGEYMAFCDGDDYWIDDCKLAEQVKYMDANPDCGLCITKVYKEVDGELKGMRSAACVNKNMSFDALLRGNAYINAQSYLIRKSDYDKYIDFNFIARSFCVWDYPIVLELIQHTRFHCLDFYSAVNVVNSESVTHTKSRIRRLKYILGQYKIKIYYIRKYGCKLSTIFYLIYRAVRHIYSIGAKRWI